MGNTISSTTGPSVSYPPAQQAPMPPEAPIPLDQIPGKDLALAKLHTVLALSGNLKTFETKIKNTNVPEAKKTSAIHALQEAQQKYANSTPDEEGARDEDRIVARLLTEHSAIRKAIGQLISEDKEFKTQKKLSLNQRAVLGLYISSAASHLVQTPESAVPPYIRQWPNFNDGADASRLPTNGIDLQEAVANLVTRGYDVGHHALTAGYNALTGIGAFVASLDPIPIRPVKAEEQAPQTSTNATLASDAATASDALARLRNRSHEQRAGTGPAPDTFPINFENSADLLFCDGREFPNLLRLPDKIKLATIKALIPSSQHETLRNLDPNYYLPDRLLERIDYGSPEWADHAGLLTFLSNLPDNRLNLTELHNLLKSGEDSWDATMLDNIRSQLGELSNQLDSKFDAESTTADEPPPVQQAGQPGATPAQSPNSLDQASNSTVAPGFLSSNSSNIEYDESNPPPSVISASLQAEATANRLSGSRSVQDTSARLKTLSADQVRMLNQAAEELLSKPVSLKDFTEAASDVNGSFTSDDLESRYDKQVVWPRKINSLITLAHSKNLLPTDIKSSWNEIKECDFYHVDSVKPRPKKIEFNFSNGISLGENSAKLKEPLGYVIAEVNSDSEQRKVFGWYGEGNKLRIEYIGQYGESDAPGMGERWAKARAQREIGNSRIIRELEKFASEVSGSDELESRIVETAEKNLMSSMMTKQGERPPVFEALALGMELAASAVGLDCPFSIGKLVWNLADGSFKQQSGVDKALDVTNVVVSCLAAATGNGLTYKVGKSVGKATHRAVTALKYGMKSGTKPPVANVMNPSGRMRTYNLNKLEAMMGGISFIKQDNGTRVINAIAQDGITTAQALTAILTRRRYVVRKPKVEEGRQNSRRLCKRGIDDCPPFASSSGSRDDNRNVGSMHGAGAPKSLNPNPNGIDKVITNARQGIPERDIRNIAGYAETSDQIIGIRPVEPLAKSLLDGGYPTKNFNIKGKSSNWGPMASFIPVDQSYSKVAGDAQKIEKYSKYNKDAISQKKAIAVNLAISPRRLEELATKSIITKKGEVGGIIELTSKDPTGKEYTFSARLENNEYKIFDASGEPVKVLGEDVNKVIDASGNLVKVPGKKELLKPIVPDYDLLTVGPSLRDFGHLDHRDLGDVSHEVFKKRMDSYKPGWRNDPKNAELKEMYDNPEKFYAHEKQNLGNVSPRVENTIVGINNALGIEDKKMYKVHHNADEASMATDLASNYPATYFLPKKMGEFEQVVMINNSAELARLVQVALDNGYHVMRNPLWGEEFTGIRRTDFTQARNQLVDRRQLSASSSPGT